ncbi:head GIN domain-containing protein [Aquimarina algicola]|uniref:DUF2807 domain-containing protein n=1 Tax=Aquimarina algicola TaxID=2589995 RepID=A0A504JRT8_9FLAO|nr:head GIN domain-containing protein [Aquimarina algicola]TPN89100.1 DUF2807 domain-containing protein [Aquimarina algicola]
MKKIIFTISLTIFSVAFLQAQWGTKIRGNGEVVSKERTTQEYDEIKVKGNLDVSLVAGKEGKIKIEGESNLIDYIITKVEGDELKIYVKRGYYLKPSNNTKFLIIVPFTDITQVTLSGSGDITGNAPINAQEFKTGLSGSGDIRLTINAETVYAQISGSGDLDLKGESNKFTCSLSGSGDIEAYDLKAKYAKATISGSGDIQLTATSEIKAFISGSGDISYKGNPEKEDKKVSGSGDISKG